MGLTLLHTTEAGEEYTMAEDRIERTETRSDDIVVLHNRTIRRTRDSDEVLVKELRIEFPGVTADVPDYVLFLAARQVWSAAQQRLRRLSDKEIAAFDKPVNAQDLTKTFGGRKVKSSLDKTLDAFEKMTPEQQEQFRALVNEDTSS